MFNYRCLLDSRGQTEVLPISRLFHGIVVSMLMVEFNTSDPDMESSV